MLAHRPFVLVLDGRIDAAALRRSRVREDDLGQRLREAGLSYCGQVRLAVLERKGKISVLRDEPDSWSPPISGAATDLSFRHTGGLRELVSADVPLVLCRGRAEQFAEVCLLVRQVGDAGAEVVAPVTWAVR